ncbi:RagB/SusD family nutrient uptake outer membrane protein [Sphingobacterium sp.]|uniref:RagB/SusD family nutrient uptake outer membrane protein n=1 Tax=Sphingobacterium sp. TaxID=341027 RepID=UPI0028A1C257|nr:RagB/SusD family nutrient uptake outer membrane protein [Sphingobacterium sp.]
MKNIINIIWLTLLITTSCKDFLDEKPRKGLVIPEDLDQLSSLLLKETESLQDPMWGEISTDDYYLSEEDFASKEENFRNAYSWAENNVFGKETVNDWLLHYRFIYYCNTVIEKLKEITPTNAEKVKWDRLMGEALFYRGKFHYDIAIIWANAYSNTKENNTLGIPLKLNTNFNEISFRSSLNDTYSQILSDLELSIQYLPEMSSHVTRPSKLASRAMLSRIYLSMGNYEKSLAQAIACLKVKSDIIDFNKINGSLAYPIPAFNNEIILHSYMLTSLRNIYVNKDIVESFKDGDLRKSVFFSSDVRSKTNFKGSYYGRATLFSGLAVDEVYLIAAECSARVGNEEEAKAFLKKLILNRYKEGTMPAIDKMHKDELIVFILNERRKELIFRGTRWGDVKRLNNENYAITMKREVGNFILLPNSPKFNLPIPQSIIDLSGISQNPR